MDRSIRSELGVLLDQYRLAIEALEKIEKREDPSAHWPECGCNMPSVYEIVTAALAKIGELGS